MAELKVERVGKSFGDLKAVDDVDLTILDREFMVLLGPSGCGKSTLLRAIAGLEPVTAGKILIDGKDVTDASPRDRRISMVFQSYAVFPHMTVFDNIAFGLLRQKKPKDVVDTRVRQAADLLHIGELLERFPNTLSGGQRQRVAVARSIAYDADVLLMDEPLSNLDALLRMEMRAELKTLLTELESTVIYVTHDQVEALSMGDRIAVMKQGALQQVDTPITVYDAPANTFVAGFIGNPPVNLIEVTVADGITRLNGHELELPNNPGDGRHLLGIRSENIELAADAPGIQAEVLVAEPLGSHNLLTCSSVVGTIKVTTHPDQKTRAGERVWLRPLPDKTLWYDPESGCGR